jgi:hypothetical protein
MLSVQSGVELRRTRKCSKLLSHIGEQIEMTLGLQNGATGVKNENSIEPCYLVLKAQTKNQSLL